MSSARFLSDVSGLAALLPGHGPVVNLCRDRYRFAVGLGAALLTDRLTLLPPGEAPGMLAELAADYPEALCLADGDAPEIELPVFPYPGLLPDAVPGNPLLPADRPAIVLFTSGSTGRPQPHMKRWGTLVASAAAAGARLGTARLGTAWLAGASLLGTVPHQHSYGIESVIIAALRHGMALQAERPLLPADITACLARLPRPRVLVTTPIHLRALLADGEALPPLDLILSATAPLSPRLARETEERFAAPLREIYGCSEAGQIAARRTAETEEWECLDGIALSQDDRGFWVEGPCVGARVLLNDVIEPLGKSREGQDRFVLHGRIADMVCIAGKRSSLAHLNYYLNAIPGVRDGVFISPAGEDERLMAFVVAPGMTAEAILSQLRQYLDPAFLPRPLRLVNALPRNELGKLTRAAAQALMERQAS